MNHKVQQMRHFSSWLTVSGCQDACNQTCMSVWHDAKWSLFVQKSLAERYMQKHEQSPLCWAAEGLNMVSTNTTKHFWHDRLTHS